MESGCRLDDIVNIGLVVFDSWWLVLEARHNSALDTVGRVLNRGRQVASSQPGTGTQGIVAHCYPMAGNNEVIVVAQYISTLLCYGTVIEIEIITWFSIHSNSNFSKAYSPVERGLQAKNYAFSPQNQYKNYIKISKLNPNKEK